MSNGPYAGRTYQGYKVDDPVFNKTPESLLISKSKNIYELMRNARLMFNFEAGTEERHRCMDAYSIRLSQVWKPKPAIETDYDAARRRKVAEAQNLY